MKETALSSQDTSLPDPRAAESAQIEATPQGAALAGALTVRSLPGILPQLEQLDGADLQLDLSALERIDTAGAYALLRLRKRLGAQGHALSFTDVRPDHDALIARVAQSLPKPDAPEAPARDLMESFAWLGKKVVELGRFMGDLHGMLGLFLARLVTVIRRPSEFRLTALVHHCDQVGLKAVPIVALMGFLIGIVLAFQGSVQLRQFGAEIFVVDLIAISILRELGILLTAIIVAGRTASSYTAAIGSMKMREEIDAMRTLAIDPALALFVPRILALLIVLPILGMIANLTGLIGGAMMAWIELGISPGMFLSRLLDDTSLDHVIVGFVKAPVFALIIGVIGCHAGMQVGGNAESLGAQTSSAVVRAIFMVIVADALFSVFFAIMGI